ncbi:hypothetical protein HDU87_004714 [Geranomyces variabilis]|uniref:Uncharacterized protein n=1 Tax=Geranomyces variabilis TaxID=109894 RepID=A0AAD5TIA7_9FUNG|nr:hypothetical protein HDU87_004714 [Geranomyces variabilis]
MPASTLDSSLPSPIDKRTYSTTDLPVSASESSLRNRMPSSLSINDMPDDIPSSSTQVLPAPTVAADVQPVGEPAPFKWTVKAVVTEMLVLPLTMFISLFSYCPFCIAVVVQSTVTKTAVDTDKWKDEMKGWAWLVGLGGFFGLLLYPTGMVTWMEHASGETVGAVIAIFLGALFVVHLLTISYAFLKPGLGMVAIPVDHRLNIWNWRNILVLLAPFFEFMQFTALAFKTVPDSWLCVSGFGNAVRAFMRIAGLKFANISCSSSLDAALGENSIQSPELMIDSAMFAFALSLLYAVLLGYAIAKLLQPGHWLCAIVFEVFAGIGYIPIVSRLMSLLACHSEENSDGTKSLLLSYAEADIPSERVLCFTDGHKKYAAMAFAGLLLFGLSAIFVGSYKADKHVRRSAVTFIPRLIVIRRTLNSTLLGMRVAINLVLAYAINDASTLAHTTQATGMATLVALLVLDSLYNSCTFQEIRLLAASAHLAALWSYITTMVVSTNRLTYPKSVVLLITGWLCVGAGVCASIIYTNYTSRAEEKSKSPEDGQMGANGETTFRVVTMGRRMRVVVALSPRNADGLEDDEDVVLAAAIYGGKELKQSQLDTLHRQISSTVALTRQDLSKSRMATLERLSTGQTVPRRATTHAAPVIRNTELMKEEAPTTVEGENGASEPLISSDRRDSARKSMSAQGASTLGTSISRSSRNPSMGDGISSDMRRSSRTQTARSSSPDGADTSPMGQLANEKGARRK